MKKIIVSTLVLSLTAVISPISCQIKAVSYPISRLDHKDPGQAQTFEITFLYPKVFKLYYKDARQAQTTLDEIFANTKKIYKNCSAELHPIVFSNLNSFTILLRQIIDGEGSTSPFQNLYKILCLYNMMENLINYYKSSDRKNFNIPTNPIISTEAIQEIGITNLSFPKTDAELDKRFNDEKISQNLYKEESTKAILALKESIKIFEDTQEEAVFSEETIGISMKNLELAKTAFLELSNKLDPNKAQIFSNCATLISSIEDDLKNVLQLDEKQIRQTIEKMHQINKIFGEYPVTEAIFQSSPNIAFTSIEGLYDEEGWLRQDIEVECLRQDLITIVKMLSSSEGLKYQDLHKSKKIISNLLIIVIQKLQNIYDYNKEKIKTQWVVIHRKEKEQFLAKINVLINTLSEQVNSNRFNLNIVAMCLESLGQPIKSGSKCSEKWGYSVLQVPRSELSDMSNFPDSVKKDKVFIALIKFAMIP